MEEKPREIPESGSGDIRAFQGLMQRLIKAMDQSLDETKLMPSGNNSILSIVTEMDFLLKKSSNKVNKEYADYVGSSREILDALFKFQNQFSGMFSTDNTLDLYMYSIMCSFLLSWTDKSHDFRSSLIDNGYLFYHVMQLKQLESTRFSEVAKELATYNIAIIANCAQESSFSCYISTIKWKTVLSPWADHPSKNIQFHSRLLCCFVASSFNPDELLIVDMNSADLQTILDMLGSASSSTELTAIGFGLIFSATEILQSLLHLFISQKNFLSLLSLDMMPAILALLLNGHVQDKLLTCQLLWILLGDRRFQWDEELFCNPIKELLTAMLENEDENLQVLSKLLLSEPCMGTNDFKDELQVLDTFLQKTPDQWCLISPIELSKHCHFIRSLSALSVNKRVLFIILLQKLESVGKFLNSLSPNPIMSSQNDCHCTEQSSDIKYPHCMWIRKMLYSCEVIMQRFLKAAAADKTDVFPFVCTFLHQMSNISSVCVPTVLKAAVDEYASEGRFWHVLYELLSLLFKAEMSGLGTKEMQICLLRIITNLRDWSAASKLLCSTLLNKGLILNHCQQLLNWTRKIHSTLVEYMVKANLRILLNCLHYSEFKVYKKAFDWLTLLEQLYNTATPAIQLATKILGCYINVQHSLELSENDINELLDVTAKAAGSPYELNKFKFYSLDVIMCLQEFVDQSRSDMLPFIQASILPVLNTVLSNGTLEEKIAISLFIWNILSLKEYDLSEGLAYSDLLQVFEVCGDDEELKNITKCILASCPENNHADLPTEDQPNNFDVLMKTAYKHGHYTECVSWCLKKESSYPSDSEDLQTKVFRAKALYHLYKSEYSKLQFDISTKDDYYKASQRCYKRTKEVIGLLGMAYDKKTLDVEGCKMLVLSMMDYIHTTNKLNDCKRCYLCWKKLHAATVTNPDSSGSDRNLKHSKLVHSHSIPYSLLNRFAHSVPSKRNLKLFRSSAEGTQMKPHKGKMYAPKQIARYMFCTTCEDILSAKGETQFMRDFFDKIYDSSDSTKSRQSQRIEYDKWLYHFCAGLIYRNLIWEENSVLNEDELYKLLLGCREYVLSSEISSNSPEIYLLITPISGDEEDLKYGSVNNVLAGSLEWYIGRHKLGSESLESEDAVLASFFLFHLGAINILVKFNPSKGYIINDCFKVKAENSQIFFVPEEMKRKEELPPGMWAHLLNEARFAEKESLEKSASPSIDDPVSISLEGFELFGIVHGVKEQLRETTAKGIQPSPGGFEKKFNFLPAGFEVRSEARPNAVSLPRDHSILVHHTFAYGTGKGETIFIVRDAIKDACYLIWNNFIPGLQYSVAFHFSPSEMLLTDVVTDKQSSNNSALQSPHFQKILDEAKKKILTVLPEVLIKKGIFNFESLLLRIKGITSFPSVDMKCNKETDCWYCSNCCDVCLKILGFDSIKMQVNKVDVSVCNQDCGWYLPGKKIKTSVIVAEAGESPPPLYKDRSCPLFTHHKKYFHVYIEDITDDLPVKGDVAVCFGDGSIQYPERKMYGVFFSRSIQKQVLLEFFLSDSFNLLCPLPYNESNFLLTSIIKAYEDDGCIRQYLRLAYDELKKPIGPGCRSDDTRESSPPSPDTLYAMVCAIADEISISDKKANDEIYSKLHCWNKDFIGLHSKHRNLVVLQIFTTPDIVKTYLTFADSLFSEVGSKHQCLWALNQMFALWSSTTPLMSQLLIENGLMTGILIELQAFSNCPFNEDIMDLIQVALSILCNLLQVSSYVAYFFNTVCDQIVSSFTTSTDPKIRILSTSVLSYLGPKLKLDYHLELKNEDVKLMIDLVINSISKYSIIIHPVPMLRSLHMIMKISESNARQFISHGLIAMISEIIETCDNILLRELVLILWTLASYSTFVEEIKSEVNLLRVVSSLKDKDDDLLSTASVCALWDIDEESRDGAGFIAFAHGCYQFGMYERCITTCTKILQLSPSDNDIQEMRLLKGKSLFQLCNEGIEKLPKTISPKDVKLKQVWNECIKYATEAVNLLGSAHDHCYIDEDGSKYLDLCMMFLISNGNALNKCQRCLLCLTNLKSAKIKQESGKQHKGLQHSHVIPKAILDAFSSGLIKTTSQRLFRLCGTETSLSQLKSPKELTWFILCSKCEQSFGIFEEQFVNKFFKRIYDVSNPASPLEAQEIVYGHWLYQFCVSLFFRGIAILDIPCNDNVKRFQNSENLYEIFVRCRQILLSPSDAKIMPSIHVLINNTLPTSEDKKLYTTMHEVLVSPEILGVAAEKDPKKYFVGPKKCNLFLAHMGIINVVVDVEVTIPSNRYLINQEGGLYHVPPDSERDQFIPPGVKEIFYTSAQQMEIQKATIPDKLRKSHWAKGIIGSPPKDCEQMFMVHPAQKKDLEVFREEGVRPAQGPSKVKDVSFLPFNFNLNQTTGLLELPSGHRLLFHCEPEGCCRSRFDKGVTVFFAIGDDSKGYTPDKPYAIYHKYDPGLQFNMAMFISSADLSVTTLINSGSCQQTAEMLCKDSHFKESMRLTLNTALHQMGFASFNSFLPHAQDKRVPSKCLTKRRCWYCINRCDNCMNAAAVGLTMNMSGMTVKFCSKVCNHEFNTNPRVLNLLPASFHLTNNNGKIAAVPPVGHTMLEYVKDHYDEDEYELAATHTIRICVGDGSVDFSKDKIYIIYETAMVLSQTLVAFFISDDFSVIPFTTPPKACDAEVAVWFSKRIQPRVQSALEDVVSQAGFASFKEWCAAALQAQ